MATRRQIMIGAGAFAVAARPGSSLATHALRDQTILELTKGASVQTGRVSLTLPGVAENGLSVYTIVAVDSPMTEADHVRKIHILSEKNPIARLCTWHLRPQNGIAKVATNIRLADSQEVMALAEMSDGSFWQDRKTVIVTLAACIDGG